MEKNNPSVNAEYQIITEIAEKALTVVQAKIIRTVPKSQKQLNIHLKLNLAKDWPEVVKGLQKVAKQ